MSSSRAFVFSLDAFVAFSIALIIIYSLIFFSSIPYAYYSSFMQVHYLAKDTMIALSEAREEVNPEVSKLDYIALSHSTDSDAISKRIGPLIPNQFGYTVDLSTDEGKTWANIYDTANYESDPHKKTYNKVKASSQSVSFGYTEDFQGTNGLPKNPYGYITCNGELTQCNSGLASEYKRDSGDIALIRLTVYT